MNADLYKCRVCQFDCYPFLPWGVDGLTPSYSICPQCGVEFGYEDSSEEGLKKYRDAYKNAKNHANGNSKK